MSIPGVNEPRVVTLKCKKTPPSPGLLAAGRREGQRGAPRMSGRVRRPQRCGRRRGACRCRACCTGTRRRCGSQGRTGPARIGELAPRR